MARQREVDPKVHLCCHRARLAERLEGEVGMSRKLRRNQVAERYGGVNPRTIDRWAADPKMGFPQPIRIGSTPLWDEAELEKWERSHAAPKHEEQAT